MMLYVTLIENICHNCYEACLYLLFCLLFACSIMFIEALFCFVDIMHVHVYISKRYPNKLLHFVSSRYRFRQS